MRTVVLTGLVALLASAGAQHPDMDVAAFYLDQEEYLGPMPYDQVWAPSGGRSGSVRGPRGWAVCRSVPSPLPGLCSPWTGLPGWQLSVAVGCSLSVCRLLSVAVG